MCTCCPPRWASNRRGRHHAPRCCYCRSRRFCATFTGELCSWTRFILAEILVLDGTAGAGGRARPASTTISARPIRVHEYSSPPGEHAPCSGLDGPTDERIPITGMCTSAAVLHQITRTLGFKADRGLGSSAREARLGRPAQLVVRQCFDQLQRN